MKIRIPLVVSIVLLAALAVLAWHNHQRLSALRARREMLAAQAIARGMSGDPANPNRSSGHLRPDRRADAKRVAAEVIGYSMEFDELRSRYLANDPVVRQRVADETERLLSLDGEQLKTLISEVSAAEQPGGFQRAEIVVFALRRLALDHPQEALEMITTSPELKKLVGIRDGYPHNVVATAARGWAATDFPAALEWLRHNRDNGPATVGVVLSAAERDPRIALAVIAELGVPPKIFPDYFAGAAKTPEQRVALLKVLHDWRATVADPAATRYDFDSAIADLVFGQFRRTEGFDTATRCIEAADLSTDELQTLTSRLEVKSGELGRWIAWLEHKLPAALAREPILKLMPKWREAEPAAAAAFAQEHGLDE
ncbi:MAG: hypothetical protein WCK77_14340 [Verrucomicrobiota bacterium]